MPIDHGRCSRVGDTGSVGDVGAMTTAAALRDLYDLHIEQGDDDVAEQVAAYVDQVEAGLLTEVEALSALALA